LLVVHELLISKGGRIIGLVTPTPVA
jgi:hypothetical protein